MGSLGPVWNRASRIASLICPLFTLARAIDLDVSGSDLLGFSGEPVHLRGGLVAASLSLTSTIDRSAATTPATAPNLPTRAIALRIAHMSAKPLL